MVVTCHMPHGSALLVESETGTKPHMLCLEDVEDVDRSRKPGEAMIMDREGRTVRVEDGMYFYNYSNYV